MRMRLSWLALGLALWPAFADAQKITGTIRGTVTDPSQAVVADAKVTLKEEETGFTRSTTTNAVGNYQFAELPVGVYRVEVEAQGFRTASHTKIVLNVAAIRAVDFELVTGAVTEAVTVEANAVEVQTMGGEVSGLVTGTQARELPLNGRNFMQLTMLMPGVNATEALNVRDKGLSGGSDMSVSGGSTTSNLWMVDGASNNDVGSNRTILVYPSIDSIAEFKIQRNNYGAEFGQAGGAQVNLVTRGGTNEWHGSGYYYARRDELNSSDYFLKQAGRPKPQLKWDDYGATVGGPILKDKLHFFFSQEWNRDKRSTTRQAFVPTLAERQGDFSGSRLTGCTPPIPVDPLTGQPFSGNRIPADRLSPAGLAMLRLYSEPNETPSSGCNNWVQAVSTPVDWRQESGRLDWTVNNTTRIMLRYTQDSWKADTNNWGDDPFPVVGSLWNQPGKSLVAQLNKNIGASSVNTLSFSYSMNKIEVTRGGENPDLVAEISRLVPTTFAASDKAQAGAAQPGFSGGAPYPNLLNQAPWVNNQDLFILKDDYSVVFGKHFVKAGVLASYNKKNEQPRNTTDESVTFGGLAGYVNPSGVYTAGTVTGNPIADLLLKGTVYNSSELQRNQAVLVRWRDLEGYLADSYRVSSRLTADFGVRLSRLTTAYMADDRWGSFNRNAVDPALGNSPCNGVLYVPGKNPCAAAGLRGGSDGPNRQLQPQKSILIAPRLGFAWDMEGQGKSVVRGGAGLFYSRERVSPSLGMGGTPPFSGTTTVLRTTDSAAVVSGLTSVGFGAPGTGWDQRAANPHNWQWNLTYQRELRRNMTLEVAYVGSKGIDLSGNTNVNQVPSSDNNSNGVSDRLDFARTGNAALRPLAGIAGIGNANVVQWERTRSSIYHSLQTQFISRFGRSSLQASYTWAKALGTDPLSSADSGLSDVLTWTDNENHDLDRGRALVDRTHVFNANLILALPALQDKSAAMRTILGDWQVTTIVSAASGYPITIYTGTVPGINATAGVAGTGHASIQRPNVVPDVDCHANGSTPEQWLNPAAWTLNGYQIGTHGNSGRGVCTGPSLFQTDLSLAKNFAVKGRAKLQLRVEVFNVFNRVNLSANGINNRYNPSNVVFDTGSGSTATSIVSAAPNANFGRIVNVRDPRQVQLGLRLSF